jgi:hypothetical protein
MKKVIFLFVFSSLFVFSEVKFENGFDLRLREEYLGNIFEPRGKEDDNYFRLKVSLWGKWDFNQNNTIFIRFSGEPRFYLERDGLIARNRYRSEDEFIFENIYFEFKKIYNSKFDFKIGRQDFLYQYGEGFVIMDGTPGDGSRTFYFDAIKTTYHFNEKDSLDFIFYYHPKEDYMPVINDNEKVLRNSNERGIIIYGKLNPLKNLSFEPYYIFKHQEEYKPNPSEIIPELDFNTIGIRNVYNFDPWKLRGEIAYQWGEYNGGNDKSAFGGYAFLTRSFKEARFSPSIEIGYSYLSGDKPSTTKDEGWDPVFSRWPWWSELMLYYYLYDGEIAKWTNLNGWRTSLNLNLSKNTILSLYYNYLRANEPKPVFNLGIKGKERGHVPQLILKHKFTDYLSSHLWIEYFILGDYYPDNHKNSLFLRWELSFKF